MKRFFILTFTFVLITGLSFTAVYARNLDLVIKGVKCADEGVVVRYSVINKKDFDYYNVSIAFKIIVDKEPAGCEEIITTIPAGADGSDISETTIEAPCKGRPYRFKSNIFHNTKRYRIEEWFSGCPSF